MRLDLLVGHALVLVNVVHILVLACGLLGVVLSTDNDTTERRLFGDGSIDVIANITRSIYRVGVGCM